MDFFVRQLEPAWRRPAIEWPPLSAATAGNLIFVENATVGMNIVADSLSAGRRR